MTVPTAPRRWASVVSAGAWLVIALVIIRMASGGGTLVGFDYVVRGAPPVAVLTGAILLLIAIALVGGFLLDATWTRRISTSAGAVAVIFGIALAIEGHDSGWVLAVAAVVALSIGWRPRA